MGKQCRPRAEAEVSGVRSGSPQSFCRNVNFHLTNIKRFYYKINEKCEFFFFFIREKNKEKKLDKSSLFSFSFFFFFFLPKVQILNFISKQQKSRDELKAGHGYDFCRIFMSSGDNRRSLKPIRKLLTDGPFLFNRQ